MSFGLIKSFKKIGDFKEPKAGLDYILSRMESSATLAEKTYVLEALIGWIRSDSKLPHEFDSQTGQLHSVRIRFLFQLLDRNPVWKKNLAHVFRSVLTETSGLELFSRAGLAQETGFFSEGMGRILKSFIPSVPHEKDLLEVFSRLFKDENDIIWVSHLSPEVFSKILDLIQFESENRDATYTSLKKSMSEALLILSTKVSSIGLTYDIRTRLTDSSISQSPFILLNRKIENILSTWDENYLPQCFAEIENCRNGVQDVIHHLEKAGVSISIVFRLETISDSLNRIEGLLKLLFEKNEEVRQKLIPQFMAELIKESLTNKSAKYLIFNNLHLLARKIVERTGASGEHYIARTRSEYFQMLRSAAGGGVMTVLTTLLKFVIVRMKLPFFFEGLFYWINYSGSFLAMQLFGFTLATKQPSMTAPALAEKLKEVKNPSDVVKFTDELITIVRSQFAAALGNVGAVIPGAILFEFLFRTSFGHPVINSDTANHLVESLHPYKSLSIPQAALTGVALWMASISGGWLENWAVFREVPESLKSHPRLIFVFGKKRCAAFSHWFSNNISGIGLNLSLGFLLAFIPIAGRFFGIPLEVKHVTLSTGALTFAICSLKTQIGIAPLVWAGVGIVFIGLMNFGVSFALALTVALRARNIKSTWVLSLCGSVARKFMKRFWIFFTPPAA